MMDAEAPVFVVEDDASLRASLQDLLESVGLRVAACASAQEFLHCPPPEGPSCLGLDVRLPGLSGLELQQELAYAGLLERTGWSTGRHGTWRPSCWGGGGRQGVEPEETRLLQERNKVSSRAYAS